MVFLSLCFRRLKTMNNKNNRFYTSDKRPALAFDNQLEVEIITTALRLYREEIARVKGQSAVQRVNNLIDELDKVKNMFNKKT